MEDQEPFINKQLNVPFIDSEPIDSPPIASGIPILNYPNETHVIHIIQGVHPGPQLIDSLLVDPSNHEEFINISKIYYYYHGRGLFIIMLSRLSNIIMIGFCILLTLILTFFTNYKLIFRVSISLEDCFYYPLGFWYYIFIIISIISILILLFLFVMSIKDIRTLFRIKKFYNNRLIISDNDLESLQWEEVSDRIEQYAKKLNYITKDNISQSVTKRDNYMIAMIEHRIFDGSHIFHRFYDIIHSTLFFSIAFDWILDNIIFPCVLPANNNIHKHNMYNIPLHDINQWSIIGDSVGVEGSNVSMDRSSREESLIYQGEVSASTQEECIRKLNFLLRLTGFIGIFLSPIILVAIIIYSFFRYTEELRNRPESALTARQWSRYARYRFKKYNELPHQFEQRLNSCMDSANNYLKQFYSNFMIVISRLFLFIFGSFISILIIIGIINERLIINKEFLDKSLLWWLTIIGIIITIFRSFSPPRYHYFNPKIYMEHLIKIIGLPDSWNNHAHDLSIMKEVGHYYPHRYIIFIHEILSVIFMPYFLIFFIPSISRNIVTFLTTQTVIHPHIGPICKLSIRKDDNFSAVNA